MLTLLVELSDGSGSIDRDEFLNIPQIASNPLASRMIAIFDSEYVFLLRFSISLDCISERYFTVEEELSISKNLLVA
jgi:hypothetical protein